MVLILQNLFQEPNMKKISDFEDKINKVDKKIPNVSSLVKKTDFNSKISKVEGKIPIISGLATTSALTAVENKISDVSSLVKKTELNTKVTEIEGKIPDVSSLATNSALTAVENKIPDITSLITKTYFDGELKKVSDKVTSNKSKHFLAENELKKLQKFDSSYFRGKDFLEENYLVFKPMNKYFKKISNTKSISSWESKGLSDDVIKSPTTNNNSLAPTLENIDKNMFVKFNGSCLIKQNKFTFNKKILNIYIVYDLDSNLNNFDPILENCLFGAINITRNSDIDKYKYSGYGLGFDSKRVFSHPTGSFDNNAVIFGVDASGSSHAFNGANNILVLGISLTQINDTTIYGEKMHSINFRATKKTFSLSLHYNGDNSYLFVNSKEIIKFKAKDSEIVEDPICLGNISKDFSESNMKKKGLYGSVY